MQVDVLHKQPLGGGRGRAGGGATRLWRRVPVIRGGGRRTRAWRRRR
ncbi:hypothetical protein Hanom_Chr09g00777791 [Helianthus anomalus]